MTYDEFITYVEYPETLTEKEMPKLKELTDKYPYFGIGHWLHLKSLKNSNNIFFNEELTKTALYSQDKRNLYFFIFPDELETKSSRQRTDKDGSYFDMITNFEKNDGNNRQSLKTLAEKLKEARESLHLKNTPH
ncbi:MAG: hypothetical protein QM751_15190 [Paludibacteraceae bacterium]